MLGPRQSAVAVTAALLARRRLPRAGAMVKLAAKCLLAGESGPSGPIRPAGGRGLERAPWGGARPAAWRRWGGRAPSVRGDPRGGWWRAAPGGGPASLSPSSRGRPDGEEMGKAVIGERWGTSAPPGRERWKKGKKERKKELFYSVERWAEDGESAKGVG